VRSVFSVCGSVLNVIVVINLFKFVVVIKTLLKMNLLTESAMFEGIKNNSLSKLALSKFLSQSL